MPFFVHTDTPYDILSLGNYKAALDKQKKAGDLKSMIADLEQKHEQEKRESQAQFRAYKDEVADNEK